MVHAVTGALQLVALSFFGYGVYRLNRVAPRNTNLRAFKLQWLLSTVLVSVIVAFFMARVINLPSLIQTTPRLLVSAHDAIREECRTHLDNGRFEQAYVTISRRTKTAELLASQAQQLAGEVTKTSMAKMLQPLLNTLLFQTGVAISFFPALVRLLMLYSRVKARGAQGEADTKFQNKIRREWAVLLPIMNAVTLLSLCVSPAFYFFIEPARAHRCIYTSGHFYTITCTLFTFAVVITHLYRNKEYCRSSFRLLQWYFGFLIAYIAMALVVVRETQKYYHDSIESTDGIMQAIPAFLIFVVILIIFQFVTASTRHLDEEMNKAKQVATEQFSEEEQPGAATSSPSAEGIDRAPSKAKKLLGEEGKGGKASSSKKKVPKSASPGVTEEEDDGVIVEPPVESPAAAAPAAPAAPEAPPMAPPVAPPMAPSAPAAPKAAAPKKSTAAAVPPEADPRDELLNAIKHGHKLKKVDRSDQGGKPAAPSGLMGALLTKMAQTRVAIDGEKDEKDDADWE